MIFQVLDAGYLKEFEEPYRLLRCKKSLLYGLVQQTGHDEAQRLFEISIKAHCNRHKMNYDDAKGNFGDCQLGCKCKDGVCPSNSTNLTPASSRVGSPKVVFTQFEGSPEDGDTAETGDTETSTPSTEL